MIKVQSKMDHFQNKMISVFYYVLRLIISFGLNFFLSQCVLFENFSPFSLILFSTSYNIGLVPTACYMGGIVGTLLTPFELSSFKYITALTMIYVIYALFQKSFKLIKYDTAVFTSVCCFVCGFLFLLVGQLTLYNVLILVGESVLICCCVYFVNYAASAFKKSCYLTSKEIIAASITLVLIFCSLHNVYLLNLSVARMLGIFLILSSLYCLRISHIVVLGSSIGIILSAVSNGGEAIFIAVVTATLAGCLFSSFSNKFSVTSFIIVYYSSLIFLGWFPWNYRYFLEPVIASLLVLPLPKAKIRKILSSYIPVRQLSDKKSKTEGLYQRCKKECGAFCDHAKHCYGKNSSELKAILNNFDEQYKVNEKIPSVSEALPFCIKPNAMECAIQRILKTKNKNELGEMVDQLNYISKRIESAMDDESIVSANNVELEQNIMDAFKKDGIVVKSVHISNDRRNFINGVISIKDCQINENKQRIRAILSNQISSPITLICEQNKIIFKETNPFMIQCAALCRAKDQETICGDQAIGFSIDKKRYCLILSDGMGCGRQAGAYSELTVSVLKRLLQGGMSISNTLNILRSVIRFNPKETFSTLDLCILNLETGMADFYKSGAYDSYLVQKDACIKIDGGGIPMGLSEEEQIIHKRISFSEDDYLVMISDGLAITDEESELLMECKHEDSQTFAKNIMRSFSYKHDDDVTVMICRFLKSNT